MAFETFSTELQNFKRLFIRLAEFNYDRLKYV